MDGIRFRKSNAYGNTQCGMLFDKPGGFLSIGGNWWGRLEIVGGPPTAGFDVGIATGAQVDAQPARRERPIKVNGAL